MGKEKRHLSHTKRRRRGVGVGESILHCKKKKTKKKLERKMEKPDQRKLEVIQPKIKNKSNLREGAFFREKQESRRTVKGEKKENIRLSIIQNRRTL